MFSVKKYDDNSSTARLRFSSFARRMTKFSAVFLSVATMFVAIPANSMVSTACDALYPSAMQPEIYNEAMKQKSDILCFGEFSLFHSGVTKTPLWAAQHLTSGGVMAAEAVDREDVFHPEGLLAPPSRSELEDYRGSGYDRGHMAPAADMATVKAQDNSFSLANMVPQLPALNRGLWSRVEGATRSLARRYGEIYVVTGPAFIGKDLKRLNGRVIVPSHVYKAVYVPGAQQAGVWWAANSGKVGAYEVISLSELSKRTGIDVFPALPAQIKERAAKLPAPKAYSSGNDVAKSRQTDQHPAAPKTTVEAGWIELGLALLQRLLK